MTLFELRTFLQSKLSKEEFEKLNNIFGSGNRTKIINHLHNNWKETVPSLSADYKYRLFIEKEIENNVGKSFLQNSIFQVDNATALNIELAKAKKSVIQYRASPQATVLTEQGLLPIAQTNELAAVTQYNTSAQSLLNTSIFIPKNKLEEISAKWIPENVSLIKNLERDAIDIIQKSVKETFSTGGRAKQIQKTIEEGITGIKGYRAKLIAEDQILKLHAQIHRQQHKNIGVKQYVWRTQGDGAVRASHAARDKEVYNYSDSPAPAEEVRCRCFEIPLIEW